MQDMGGIGPPTPYQQLRKYAETHEDGSTLLQKALMAMFSKIKRKKLSEIMDELRDTELLSTYLINGELHSSGIGAAGPGFPLPASDSPDDAGVPLSALDSPDGAGTGAAEPGFLLPALDSPDGAGTGGVNEGWFN